SYTVQGKEVNSSTYVQLQFNGSKTSYGASGLDQGTTYVWKIQANCATDTSVFSAEDTFTTLLCPTPTGLLDTFITANSVWLAWNKVDEAQNYRLFGKESSNSKIVQYVIPPDTVIFINSLISNSTYFWAVQAICDAPTNNNSFLSKISNFTTSASASEKMFVKDNTEVYPNPARNFLNIKTKGLVEITDLSGQIMFKGNGDVELKINKWSPGIYMVETTIKGEETEWIKLIVY
ncbi:MAG: T9SS type A sorting domain-containing protein, partial [Bacteroidia bacterium]|nr:T9SS type A sorting domain-containing protein [Bacteroidia bacterium]